MEEDYWNKLRKISASCWSLLCKCLCRLVLSHVMNLTWDWLYPVGVMHWPCVQNWSHQGCKNPRQLFTRVTKFCTASPNIFVIIVAVFSCTYKNVYQFPCTKHKVSDDCGLLLTPELWVFSSQLHVTLLMPKIWRWHIHFLENLSSPWSDTVYIAFHNNYSNNCTTVLVCISHLKGGG